MQKNFFKAFVFLAMFAVAVLGFSVTPLSKGFFARLAYAGSGDALSGYAWSETIGWISFNCTSDPGGCGSSNYGVNMDNNGNFSGYAWSENVGWISFNSADLAGCPHAPCTATYNFSTNQMQGWARALAANSPSSPGWDGWISLNCTTGGAGCGSSTYAVSYNTGASQFQGFAWGSDVVGWISFNCTTGGSNGENICGSSQYGVSGVLAILSNPSVTPIYCGVPQSETFSWDSSGGNGTSYEIQAANNSGFSPVTVDATVTSTSDTITLSSNPQANQLAYGVPTYYWRVRAVGGSWLNGPSFSTPAHYYPQSGFTWSPTSPSVGQVVTFTDQTNFATGSTNHTWSWNISSATYVDGTRSTSQNPHVKFSSQQNVSVSLTASDDVGSCTYPRGGPLTITVKPPLPQFKEVQP